MKCAACGYYNLPNVTVCGRCQRSLSAATAPADTKFADIYPPRAYGRSRTWRLERWWQGTVARIPRPRLPRPGPIPRPRFEVGTLATAGVDFRRSLALSFGMIPGVGAMVHGKRREAAIQSGIALALIVLFVATIYHDISNLFAFLFLALVTYCQFDTFRLAYPMPRDMDRNALRTIRYGAMSIVMVVVTAIVTMRLAGDIYLVGTNALEPAMHRGDMMIVRDALRVQRGDVVATSVDSSVYYGGEHGVEIQGLVLERVLGLPGDTLNLHAGSISVNGAPLAPPSMPLSRMRPQSDTSFTVPPHSVCIWRPRLTATFDDGPLPSDVTADTSPFMLVTDSDIVGRVVAVVSPPEDRHIMK